MLLQRSERDGIAGGTIDLVFRRWRRPSVKAGGTLRSPVGLLAIDFVDAIEADEVTDADARRAGFGSAAHVLAELARHREGQLYRIRVRLAGPDPRVALREDTDLSPEQRAGLIARLDRLDRTSSHGPWTRPTLQLIAAHPGVRAADLAQSVGRDKPPFKLDVRKLKELGLTISLEVGYRLSPRGEALLARLEPPIEARPSPTEDG